MPFTPSALPTIKYNPTIKIMIALVSLIRRFSRNHIRTHTHTHTLSYVYNGYLRVVWGDLFFFKA